MPDLTREEAKALRAELAQELGYYPARLDPESIAHYRREVAETPHQANRWNHLREEKRQRDAEARGRAEVADLYE